MRDKDCISGGCSPRHQGGRLMTGSHDETFGALLQRIERAPAPARYAHIPTLRRMIAAQSTSGQPAPCQARAMLRRLEEEAAEDMFDNMPV